MSVQYCVHCFVANLLLLLLCMYRLLWVLQPLDQPSPSPRSGQPGLESAHSAASGNGGDTESRRWASSPRGRVSAASLLWLDMPVLCVAYSDSSPTGPDSSELMNDNKGAWLQMTAKEEIIDNAGVSHWQVGTGGQTGSWGSRCLIWSEQQSCRRHRFHTSHIFKAQMPTCYTAAPPICWGTLVLAIFCIFFFDTCDMK